jgi:hypothetical protein
LESFTNAVLDDAGEWRVNKPRQVISQGHFAGSPGRSANGHVERSFRVDVEAIAESGEIIPLEVQLAPFKLINERLLFYVIRALTSKRRAPIRWKRR